jgi:hypothetical protein
MPKKKYKKTRKTKKFKIIYKQVNSLLAQHGLEEAFASLFDITLKERASKRNGQGKSRL